MKLFFRFSILVLLLFFTQSVEAQTPHEKYQQESIYLSNWDYVKNGQKYPIGFFANQLGKELKSSPNAYAEFKKFKKNRNIGSLLALGGIAAIYGAGMGVEEAEDISVLRTGIMIGGLAAAVISIPFSVKAGKSFHKSVWIYNGDLLLPK